MIGATLLLVLVSVDISLSARPPKVFGGRGGGGGGTALVRDMVVTLVMDPDMEVGAITISHKRQSFAYL